MQKLVFIFSLFLFSITVKAQEALDDIVESEKKHFLHLHKSTKGGAGNSENVTYQRLEFQVNPNVKYIAGKVTTYFIPATASNFIEFDLSDSLTVDSIVYHQTSLSFSHVNEIIHANFPSTISALQTDSIAVYYHGVPTGSGFGSFVQSVHDFNAPQVPPNNTPVIWTLSEPYGAKDWWPCKQNLSDKIDSIDILVTAPDSFQVASNGLIVQEIINGNLKTTHWKHRYPIAAYLVCFAVTNYATFNHYIPFNGDTLLMSVYAYPEHLADAQSHIPDYTAFMQLYDTLFGAYPFYGEKYGIAEFGWGGGMEHQTMTFQTSFGFELTAHELAHHWFGDKLTCSTWNDIWLNEGFATYLAGLCYEHIGPQWWEIYKSQKRGAALAEPHGSVWCDDTTSVGRIFNSHLSYAKGAMVLHSLRYVLGDEIFYQSLKKYLSDVNLAYAFASTSDLQKHVEAESGKDLSQFFNDWIYGKGFPTYQISWSQNFDNVITATVNQTQSDPSVSFFEMPLPLLLKNGNRDTTLILEHHFSGEAFSFPISFLADSLIFDPHQFIIWDTAKVTRLPAYDFSFFVYPNPVKEQLQLRVEALQGGKAEVQIYNALGQLVLNGTQEFTAGRNTLQLEVKNFLAGTYQINMNALGKKVNSTFVKVN